MIYGYARRSTPFEDQKDSLLRQNHRITELAATRSGSFWGVEEETGSAHKTPYDKRPVFMVLLTRLKKGDELIVENLQRLDRGPYRVPKLLEELRIRGVTLTLLDPAVYRDGIPLDELQGQMFIYTLCTAGAVWMAQHRQGRRDSCRIKKAKHEPYTSFPPLGFQWGEDDKGKSVWVNDFPSQDAIRELVRRYHGIWHGSGECEPVLNIAKDFLTRNVTLAGCRGKSNLGYITDTDPKKKRRRLVHRYKHTKTGCPGIDHRAMRKAYARYVNELLLDETEFAMPIDDYSETEPKHVDELRWLQKVFREQWGKEGFADVHQPPKM